MIPDPIALAILLAVLGATGLAFAVTGIIVAAPFVIATVIMVRDLRHDD